LEHEKSLNRRGMGIAANPRKHRMTLKSALSDSHPNKDLGLRLLPIRASVRKA
jgi:hypothetical protein